MIVATTFFPSRNPDFLARSVGLVLFTLPLPSTSLVDRAEEPLDSEGVHLLTYTPTNGRLPNLGVYVTTYLVFGLTAALIYAGEMNVREVVSSR